MLRILLIEHNPGDVMVVYKALRAVPIESELLVAHDGAQARKFLRSDEFDLVLVDLNAPEIDGYALLREFSSFDGAPPFIALGTTNRETDRELALILGAREYLVKPTERDRFNDTIVGFVERWSRMAASKED